MHTNIPGKKKSRPAVCMFKNSWCWYYCMFWSMNGLTENSSIFICILNFGRNTAVMQYGITVLKIVLVLKKDSNIYSVLSSSHSEIHGTSQDKLRTTLELKHTHTPLLRCNAQDRHCRSLQKSHRYFPLNECSLFSPLLWKQFLQFLCHSFLLFLIQMLDII